MSDSLICLECSRVNPTCCRLNPGMEKSCFPLSLPEIEGIRDYLSSDDFFVREINDKSFLLKLARMIPESKKIVYELFPLDNFHARLKTNRDGSCCLLAEDGCLLPDDIRPAYCLLYPFWFQNNRLIYLKDPLCIAQNRHNNIRELIRLFRIDPQKLKKEFNLMINNLRLGGLSK